MNQLELSMNVHFLESLQYLQQLLVVFQQEHDCSVNLNVLTGSNWRSLVYMALYRRGSDVSEIGTTWVSGLANIGALRPFTADEIAALGGETDFFPTLWQANQAGDGKVYTIPFLADTRLIYYWRDMFDQAGVDETEAFTTVEQVEETLNSLTRIILTPWVTPTLETTHDVVYSSASWVWGSGGDFLSPDGRQVLFSRPEARKGLKAYFGLNSYLPQKQPIEPQDVLDLFCQRRVAAAISGPWLMRYLVKNLPEDGWLNRLGVTFPPGPPFIGGMQLGIWQYAQNQADALDLVTYLLTPNVQRQLCPLGGQLPARCSVAENLPAAERMPHYETFLKGIRMGRNPAMQPLWGLVEEKLALAYSEIWDQLLDNPEVDLDDLLDQVLLPLAASLDRYLGSDHPPQR